MRCLFSFPLYVGYLSSWKGDHPTTSRKPLASPLLVNSAYSDFPFAAQNAFFSSCVPLPGTALSPCLLSVLDLLQLMHFAGDRVGLFLYA